MNGKEKMNPLEDNKLDGVSGGYSGKMIETIFTTAGGLDNGRTVHCSSCGRQFKLYTEEDARKFEDHEARCKALMI